MIHMENIYFYMSKMPLGNGVVQSEKGINKNEASHQHGIVNTIQDT